jgi:Protein of unknown function (DUF5661)
MTETQRTTSEEARRVGDAIGIVTHDDPILTGKIALAHMKEFPDYYERLKRMEREAERDWTGRQP